MIRQVEERIVQQFRRDMRRTAKLALLESREVDVIRAIRQLLPQRAASSRTRETDREVQS